jgi:ABC-type nickel/cobalt efflux system permease component RcnA
MTLQVLNSCLLAVLTFSLIAFPVTASLKLTAKSENHLTTQTIPVSASALVALISFWLCFRKTRTKKAE